MHEIKNIAHEFFNLALKAVVCICLLVCLSASPLPGFFSEAFSMDAQPSQSVASDYGSLEL